MFSALLRCRASPSFVLRRPCVFFTLNHNLGPNLRQTSFHHLPSSRSFFTSTKHALRYHPPNYQPPKKFLGFLDKIPTNVLFWGIIGTNLTVFFLWQSAEGQARQLRDLSSLYWMYENFTNSIANLKAGRYWTVITNTFSHKDAGHIFFNMFTFYFMGQHVLEMIGSRQFVFLYLGSGIVSSLTSMGYARYVKQRDRPAHGASGAIYAVVTTLACAAPRMSFMLYGIIPIPAWIFVSGLFAYDSYRTLQDKSGFTDTVGHIGGIMAGIGYFLSRRYRLF